jgi:hypothetical protein
MRVVASHEARELIAERGGRLYVSIRVARCCGATRTLRTATEQPEGAFRVVGDAGDFEVLVPQALGRLPDELHVAVAGRRRRIEAYWDGCAWVV